MIENDFPRSGIALVFEPRTPFDGPDDIAVGISYTIRNALREVSYDVMEHIDRLHVSLNFFDRITTFLHILHLTDVWFPTISLILLDLVGPDS